VLPEWLAVGLGIAVAFTAGAGVLFVVAQRVFPAEPVSQATDRSGEWKRRREIREYLRAIDEPFAEDHFVAGTHVAFYLPSRQVAVTFDAAAYFRIQNAGVCAVLAEHEMPGRALGGRLPFETPPLDELFDDAVDGDGEADVDSVAAAFETLGVDGTATESEVKRAYRERVKAVHPDHGGDRETFERVREAYATARQAAQS
jgi:hypothetical protein